jgi:hypothetical protein
MHSAQFIERLANIVGLDAAAVRVFDRCLADSDLRKKARGRNLPDVTTGEAAMLLIAILSGAPATRCALHAAELAASRIHSGLATERDLKMLGRAVGIDAVQVADLNLEQVITRLCRRLASGADIAIAEFAIDSGITPTIKIRIGAREAEIKFAGTISDYTPRLMREVRSIDINVLRFVGDSTTAETT